MYIVYDIFYLLNTTLYYLNELYIDTNDNMTSFDNDSLYNYRYFIE
jgi:hypothetical protein